ncbi:hypothetical protein [Ectopseudomonas khazarica]|uniref:hypothetical protein n=1 Tax=Ectopseudomonas khazarica TaxID=2502979 RepID=UPI003B92B0A7
MLNNICVLFVFIVWVFSAGCQAEASGHGLNLCTSEEILLFGFRVSGEEKYMSLCEGRDEGYLTYRFGTPANVELQYPEILDEESWDGFSFYGYSRGGGVKNDAMGDYSISFINQGVEYTVSQSWRLRSNEYFIGILLNMGAERVVLQGEHDSQFGSLVVFEKTQE